MTDNLRAEGSNMSKTEKLGALQLQAKLLLIRLPWCDCGQPASGMLADGTDICPACMGEDDELAIEIDYPWHKQARKLRDLLDSMPAFAVEEDDDERE